jgi:hypothetical protein
MGVKGNTVLTYRDLMSGLKGDKTFDHDIVELMVEQNPMLDDIVISEANDGTSNKTTIRTGLPSTTWTQFYQGVQASKGSKQQIRNTAGSLKTKIEIDADLFNQAPDKSALLLDEVSAHSDAMMNDMADCLIYGKIASEPKKFNGLINFYDTLGGVTSTDDKESKHYVFSAKSATQASTSALRSIWLVGWGQKSIRGFYPRGSKGGLSKGEFKKVDVTDTEGGTYEAMRQYLTWQMGLDVRDYRYAGRLANLQSDEMFDTTGVPEYVELLRRLMSRVHSNGVRQVWYMDKLTWEAVGVWLARKTMSNAIQFRDIQERPSETLFGIPVRICDALNSNETEVTA